MTTIPDTSAREGGADPLGASAAGLLSVLGCIGAGLLLAKFTREVFLAPLGIIAGAALAWRLRGGSRGGFARLGLRRPASLGWTTAIAAALIVVAWLLSQAVGRLVVPVFGPPNYSQLAALVGHPLRIALLMLVNWTSAAFGEEMVFRGFFIPALAERFGGRRAAWGAAILASSLLFAAVHAYQGVTGMIITGTIGLVFAVGFVAGERNLWQTVLAHGIFNTVALGLFFAAASG
jgi:membrane protease YdiL (CAAX protease family)